MLRTNSPSVKNGKRKVALANLETTLAQRLKNKKDNVYTFVNKDLENRFDSRTAAMEKEIAILKSRITNG